jgi:hypothetical protein
MFGIREKNRWKTDKTKKTLIHKNQKNTNIFWNLTKLASIQKI